MELTAEWGHQVKHSYLISVQDCVVSAAALDAFLISQSCWRDTREILFMYSVIVVPGYKALARLAAVDHVEVFLGIDVISS